MIIKSHSACGIWYFVILQAERASLEAVSVLVYAGLWWLILVTADTWQLANSTAGEMDNKEVRPSAVFNVKD